MPHVNEMHAHHDQILVVSLASGDLATADRDRATAQSLVESCADCARLHDDVLAIAQATKALPAPVRTRDFQISPEQAARLRPAGWRRFLASPGPLFSRQLGVGLTTLGIAGLLISSLPAMSIGMGSSAGASAAPARAPAYESTATDDSFQAAGPAASAAPTAPDPESVMAFGSPAATLRTTNVDTAAGSSPVPSSNDNHTVRNSATGAPDVGEGGGAPADLGASPAAAQDDPAAIAAVEPDSPGGGPSGLAIASGALLVAGLLLLVVRSVARRADSA